MAAPQHVHSPVEADDDDEDSGLDVRSLTSSTTSIGSSILKSREENGRTYHAYKDGKYVIPNDEDEKDRLDLQHHLYLLTFGGELSIIPKDSKKKIHRVLDIGTGTGIWAIDYGDEHPEAQEVFGVDLSPMQPSFLPPNVIFEIDDAEEPWTYHEKFDFIHARGMTGSFKDWPRFFEKSLQFLTPGGYLQVIDTVFQCDCDDGTLKEDSALFKWGKLLLEGAEKMGRPIATGLHYKQQMERAGFVDVIERRDIWPGGRWPKDARLKELGTWNRENMISGLEAFTMALFTRVLGWSPEVVQVFLVDVRKDIKDPKIHYYIPLITVLGRKTE